MDQLDYLLTKELTNRHETLVDGLARGAPEGYPEYCRLVGEVQGIRFALHALAAIRNKVSVDEDAA